MARRRRSKPHTATAPKPAPARDHMARVHASDETWTDFRAAAGQQPLNELLGELVQRHVERYRSRRLHDGELDDTELLAALARARELHSDVAAIVSRLEQRLGRSSARDRRPANGTQEHLDLDGSDAG